VWEIEGEVAKKGRRGQKDKGETIGHICLWESQSCNEEMVGKCKGGDWLVTSFQMEKTLPGVKKTGKVRT